MTDFPMIWTRRPKIIETRDPMSMSMGMAGEFRLQVYRPDGRLRHDTGFFPNLITNLGLNAPGANVTYSSISVGTGNTAPAFTDTNLVARVATTSTDAGGTGYTSSVGTPGDADWYTAYTLNYRFAQGVAAGNLTEIGVTTSGSPWNCYSRALILDGLGAPTTITVLADEYLDVTYRHRWYAGGVLTDTNSTITISGSNHDVVLRRAEVDGGSNCWRPEWMWSAGGGASNPAIAYDGSIGLITAGPSGASSAALSTSESSYVADSYQVGFSATWGLSNGNFGTGISAMQIRAGTGRVSPGGGGSAAAAYQFSLSPVISKTSAQVLTMNFTQSWARATI